MANTPVFGWPYQGRLDQPHGPNLGEKLALAIEATVNSIVGQWLPYPTVWSTFGPAPVLGNGTLVSRYSQIGKTTHLSIKLTIGSTTNPQAGQLWRFTAPVAAATDAVFPLLLEDAVPGVRWPGSAVLGAGGIGIDRVIAADGTGGVTGNAPFAWAVNDIFWLNGTYEAA